MPALLTEEERHRLFAEMAACSPALVAVFRLPDLQALYVNSAGLLRIDPAGGALLERLALPTIVGVGSINRLGGEILPALRVLGVWAGTIDLRDVLGTEFRSNVMVREIGGGAGAAAGSRSRYCFLHGSLPSKADSPARSSASDEEMLHAFLESTPDRIYFKDTQSRYLRISRSKAAKHNLPDPGGAIGRTDFDFFAVEHAAKAFLAEQNVLKTGEPMINFEERMTYEDGRVAWASTSRLPFRDRAGKLIGTFGISHDITDRKQAEEALRDSEMRFRTIFEGSSDSILLLADGRYADCNPKTLEMFGCSKETLVGLRPEDLSPALQPDGRASAPAFAECMATALRDRWLSFDWIHLRADGTEFPAEVLLSAFHLGGRQILQATVRDNTERKQAELEKREMESRLLLSQKLESVGRLAAGVAHEINTPTQYISDNTRFLSNSFRQLARFVDAARALRASAAGAPALAAEAAALAETERAVDLDYLTGEIPRTLEQTLEGLARIAKIVGSLKEFSHPGGSVKSLADINRAIETAVAVSRHEWKYVAEVATELDPGLPGVPCILDEFNQAILNLIVNAAHAIEDANARLGRPLGRITIRSRRRDDSVLVEVEDTGTGIPPEISGRIFEPFFTTKGIGKGTGQGLGVVRNVIVKSHGGDIAFTTEVGKGTTFRITLPISQPAT